MTFERKKLGASGEDLAAEFLLQKGYRILARNMKTRYGEIDILALDRKTTVVVEVKTKTSVIFGTPAEMVTPKKQQTLRNLAETLAADLELKDYRIDVVSVDASVNPAVIEHLISAV